MIRLKKLYTFPEITKPIIFKNGLNFILGERDGSSQKTNGVGKSMSIEFINFCLLTRIESSRVAKIPSNVLPPETLICLDLVINDYEITILRSLKNADNPEIITNKGNKVTFDSAENALHYLNDLYYTNKSVINLNPSFRELLNPSIRDERSEFKDIVSYFDTKKRIPSDHMPTLYMLGFDVAVYRLAKTTIKEVDKITSVISNLKNSLTHNNTRNLSDVRANVNSSEGELKKLEDELEELKTFESFDVIQNQLVDIDSELDKLRTENSFLKLSIHKIRSLPEIETINEEDVLFVYEQFKEGLGNQLKKTFEEVNSFKNKIENFQNYIVNEKLKNLIARQKKVSSDIKTLDDERSKILNTFDKDGIFKDLKQSLAIYHQKSEESSLARTQLKSYDANIKEKNRLKSVKSSLVTRIDTLIVENDKKIESFNNSISDIHEFIMGNKTCSFDIVTVNKDTYKDVVKFNMSIDYGGSHSVERIKVFIYDLALLFNENTKHKHPNFLIHDNIFDVDQDTLFRSLNYLYSLENQDSFQYILTLNSDKFENKEATQSLDFDIHDFARAIFTKTNRFIIGDKYSEI